MEIEVREEKGNIEHHIYLSPSGIARKLELGYTPVSKCIKKRNIPSSVLPHASTKIPENRIKPEHVLDVIDCIASTYPGVYPDLENKHVSDNAIIFEINPAERPRNLTTARRGRTFPTRRLTFTA